MNFNNEKLYKEYFEGLAISHQDIDGFIFGDDHIVNTSQRSDSQGVILWLDYYRPISFVGHVDNFIANISADFVVMQSMSKAAHSFAQQQQLYINCEEIVQQIFAKIDHDYQVTEILENQPMWDTAQFGRMQDHNKAGTTYIGASAELAFRYSLKMEMNTNKWI